MVKFFLLIILLVFASSTLAVSQIRLLTLISRKKDIQSQLLRLNDYKRRLVLDMELKRINIEIKNLNKTISNNSY